jgi:curved DNA-binding protein CbpA
MLSLRIHGLSSSSSPTAPNNAVWRKNSRTSSERELEDECRQWKQFEQEPSSLRGGARGQQVEVVRASNAFKKKSSPTSSKGPSIKTSYSVTAPRSSAKKANVYHHQRLPVSPCIESTNIPFEDGNGDHGDGQGAPLSGNSAPPDPALNGLAEITEDEDRDEDQTSLAGRRRRPTSSKQNHQRSNSGNNTALAASSSADDDAEEFDDDSPIPDHFVKHIKAAFDPAAGSGAQRNSSSRLARASASSASSVADLYRDVLRVDQFATDRELRTAFFKRGRQVLGSQFLGGLNDDDRSTDSAAETKQQFQAISMAYEILTTPELRSYYDRRGLVSSPSPKTTSPPMSAAPGIRAAPSNLSRPSSPTFEALKQQLSKDKSERSAHSQSSFPSPSRSASVSPALRGREGPHHGGGEPGNASGTKPKSRSLSRGRKSARNGRSRSASRSIRWSDHVEQLVFERSPDELQGMRNSGGRKDDPDPDAALVESALSVMMGDRPHVTQRPRKLRKVKRRVVLEAQELARELEAMHDNPRGCGNKDRQNFISYFLDDLEASLDGLEASVDSFWRFAISSTGSAEGSNFVTRGSKSKEFTDGPKIKGGSVQNDNDSTRKDGAQVCDDDEEDEAIDTMDHFNDDTSIRTEEFMQAAFRAPQESAVPQSSYSFSPGENRSRECSTQISAGSLRMSRETTPSLDEQAEQELSTRKILGDVERNSDAGSRSSSITSGRARAAQDPALNSERLSVRERVAVLAAAASATTAKQTSSEHNKQSHSHPGPPNPKPTSRLSRFRRLGLKSKSLKTSSDVADLLYSDLPKPLPLKSAAPVGPATSHRVDARLNDVINELFKDLTKPPPSGYDESSAIMFSRLANKKATRKPRSRSCGPSFSRSLGSTRDQTILEASDPFRLDDMDVRPPQRIYDSASNSRDLASLGDTATLNTFNTMRATETTAALRDRILSKHREAALAGKQRAAETTHVKAPKSSQVASTVAVDAASDRGFDEGFDALTRSFETQDPDVLRLDRTIGSAMSSLTGHASHYTAQKEHAWRHLCNTSLTEFNRDCSFDEGDAHLGSACNTYPVASSGEDLGSRIMVYMQALTEGVDMVGLSISNIMSAAVAVPEDNVQGVLNVLPREMDSTKR